MHSVKDAIAYGLQEAQYKDVREHQGKVIKGYCSGKDVFLSAPTGSGKSLTFTTVFIDTRLSKTKHPRKRFQNFRQSCMLSTDRIEIHQSQPASMT